VATRRAQKTMIDSIANMIVELFGKILVAKVYQKYGWLGCTVVALAIVSALSLLIFLVFV